MIFKGSLNIEVFDNRITSVQGLQIVLHIHRPWRQMETVCGK